MNILGLLWRTIRHLTPRQVLYQLISRLRGRARLRLPESVPPGYFLVVPEADKPVSLWLGVFTFLNESADLARDELIMWNYLHFGKLWTYNLNYFDYLSQPRLKPATGLTLMRDFIGQTDSLRDGLEPYPTSLRIVNWVQFLSRHQIRDNAIDAHLYAQIGLLRRRLEYRLAGNHLLENGFGLLTGALYFQHRNWFQVAVNLIRHELTTQILADGGHDERSPMYHQILLDGLLDVLLMLRHDTWHYDSGFVDVLTEKAARMLGWLDALTFDNGDVPMVNDAAPGIAPTTAQLRQKAGWMGLTPARPAKIGSGYYLFRPAALARFRYELFADAGTVGPDHQPGHAHADTFSFVLYVNNRPVLVDSGTSTYKAGERRAWERGTAAHNTVEVSRQNSSEVWGGFRVGRRARVTILTTTETELAARHDGYRHLGILHERTWTVEPAKLCIFDRLIRTRRPDTAPRTGIARFHVHPDLNVAIVGETVMAGPVRLTFESATAPELRLTDYDMADGFNRLRPGQCLEVTFRDALKTTILPAE